MSAMGNDDRLADIRERLVGIGEELEDLSCMVKEMSQHIEDPVPPYGLARWTADFDEEGFSMEFAVPVDPRLEEAASRLGFE